MKECESFEIAIEMRKKGVADLQSVADLIHHLESCSSCRRYEALVRQTEDTMQSDAQTMDLSGLEGRIGRVHQSLRNRIWIPLILMPAVGIALSIITGKTVMFVTLGATALIVFLGLRFRIALEARSVAHLGRTQREFVEFYRALLKRRIRQARIMLVLFPIILIQGGVRWYSGQAPSSLNTPAALGVLAIVPAIGYAWILYRNIKEVPAMKRELQDLDKG